MPVRHTAEVAFHRSLPIAVNGQKSSYTTIRLRFPDKGGQFALLRAEFESLSARIQEGRPESLVIEGFWRSFWSNSEARDRKRRERVLWHMQNLARKRLLSPNPADEGIEIENPWTSGIFKKIVAKWAAEDLAEAMRTGKYFHLHLIPRS